LVIVTADHGETLSAAHDWVVKLDGRKQKHALPARARDVGGNRASPGPVSLARQSPGRPARHRSSRPPTDLVPTILDLLKLPIRRQDHRALADRRHARIAAGSSAIVVEGRSARSFQLGNWRLVEREPAARLLTRSQAERSYELYDSRVRSGRANEFDRAAARGRRRPDEAARRGPLAEAARPTARRFRPP
jgi:hypothetical protein